MLLNGVEIGADGKLVSTGKPAKAKGERPPKFPYPRPLYEAILGIAKADGLDVGEKQPDNTRMVNTVTNLVLNQYVQKRRAQAKKGA